jgi:hypothetical protein
VSRRKYTDESLTIQELAYLLWATQGVRKVTMGGKGSLRTVPSSGARNPFETYLAINRVHGIAPGVYRYLPFEHKLVHLAASKPGSQVRCADCHRTRRTDKGHACSVKARRSHSPRMLRTKATFSSTMLSLSPRCMPTFTTSVGLMCSKANSKAISGSMRPAPMIL